MWVRPSPSAPDACLFEWLMKSVQKTDDRKLSEGSNPSASAKKAYAWCLSSIVSFVLDSIKKYFNLMYPMRGAIPIGSRVEWSLSVISINAPRAGCNSKTIQSKYALISRRMYSFANYALHILKHQPTYCIGTTLQLFFWCEASSNFMFTWGSHHFDNSIIAYTVLLCIRFCGNKKEPPFTSKIMPHLK